MDAEREKKRQQIVSELIETEEQYVSDLELTLRLFLKPIREQQILTKDEIKSTFANMEGIYSINSQLLQLTMFKFYALYCATQPELKRRLDRLKKENQAFGAFLKDRSSLPECRHLQLEDFLITPLQRITRYPLLFERIFENTSTKDDDYANLTQLMEELKKVVSLVNETTGKAEMIFRMKKIEESFGKEGDALDLLQYSRKLLREATAKVIRKSTKTKVKLYLFTDLLLIAKPKSDGGNSLMRKIELYTTTEEGGKGVPLDVVFTQDVPDSEGTENVLEISRVGDTSERLEFNSKEEKRLWMKDIDNCTTSFSESWKAKSLAFKKNSSSPDVNSLRNNFVRSSANAQRPVSMDPLKSRSIPRTASLDNNMNQNFEIKRRQSFEGVSELAELNAKFSSEVEHRKKLAHELWALEAKYAELQQKFSSLEVLYSALELKNMGLESELRERRAIEKPSESPLPPHALMMIKEVHAKYFALKNTCDSFTEENTKLKATVKEVYAKYFQTKKSLDIVLEENARLQGVK